MIDQLLERLQMVQGAVVREGFYAASNARDDCFIFLQPYDSAATYNNANNYKEQLALQVVAGIKVSSSAAPTRELINLVRRIRAALFKGERDASHPSWLKPLSGTTFGFKELEACKYIMPEAQERHALAVITLSLSTTPLFEDEL